MAELALSILLLIWLVATLLAQRVSRPILNYDYLGLIPICDFFGPRPIAKDIGLYFRTFNKSNLATPWQSYRKRAKPWWCGVWHPEHHIQKATIDLCRGLPRTSRPLGSTILSIQYLVLLAACEARANALPGERVQFLIACDSGFESPTREVIFLSNAHLVS